MGCSRRSQMKLILWWGRVVFGEEMEKVVDQNYGGAEQIKNQSFRALKPSTTIVNFEAVSCWWRDLRCDCDLITNRNVTILKCLVDMAEFRNGTAVYKTYNRTLYKSPSTAAEARGSTWPRGDTSMESHERNRKVQSGRFCFVLRSKARPDDIICHSWMGNRIRLSNCNQKLLSVGPDCTVEIGRPNGVIRWS